MMSRWSLVAAAAAAPVWAYVSTPGASCGLCFGRDRAGRAVLLSSHLRASLSEEVAACEVGAAAQSLRRAEGVNTILPRRPNSGSAINKCPKDTRDSEKMDLFGFDVAEFNALLDGIKCRRSDSLEHRLLGDEEGDRANRMVLTRFDAAEINALFDDIKSRSLDSLERRLFVLLGDKPTDGLSVRLSGGLGGADTPARRGLILQSRSRASTAESQSGLSRKCIDRPPATAE